MLVNVKAPNDLIPLTVVPMTVHGLDFRLTDKWLEFQFDGSVRVARRLQAPYLALAARSAFG
jgi:hypothetical protein